RHYPDRESGPVVGGESPSGARRRGRGSGEGPRADRRPAGVWDPSQECPSAGRPTRPPRKTRLLPVLPRRGSGTPSGGPRLLARKTGRGAADRMSSCPGRSGSATSYVALDPASGRELWERALPGEIRAGTHRGDRIHLVCWDGHLHALDRRDGSTRWSLRLDFGDWAPTPLV